LPLGQGQSSKVRPLELMLNYQFRVAVLQKEKQLSRFKKLSQSIWHCQYHIVWVPKYRYRVLTGEIARDVENLMRAFSHRLECEIIELNV